MGDHYIPKYYLKGFTGDTGNLIWTYDRASSTKFRASIENVGHEVNFYSPEMEQYLANKVEGPGNKVIEKIRERQPLTDEDKRSLSEYMVVFMKRVPQSIERYKERAPDAAQRVKQKLDNELDSLMLADPSRAPALGKVQQIGRQLLDQFAENPSKDVWLDLLPPDTTPKSIDAICAMTWCCLTYDAKPAFLTCDNPVYFHTGMGLTDERAEVTFPLSSNVALWATWRKDLQEGYFPACMPKVKEFNRRMAHNATRFVFHAIDEYWVLPFVCKGRYKLNRIV